MIGKHVRAKIIRSKGADGHRQIQVFADGDWRNVCITNYIKAPYVVGDIQRCVNDAIKEAKESNDGND